MPTFDVVSKYEVHEVENTVNIVKRDILNRYDFKGSSANISLDKKNNCIKIESDSEMHLDSIKDMLEKRAVTRNVSLKTFQYEDIEKGSGMIVKQMITLKEGISKDNAKTINKIIKNSKLKIQSQIQGEQVRVTGKKIDDLQNIIKLLKEETIDIPLQFINMKK